MKKETILKATTIIIVILIISLAYVFFTRQNRTTTTGENVVTNKEMTAEDIANKLKENNNNIGKIVVYTAETDKNNLLGRPNQYTSKVQFADNRISQEFVEEDNAIGGTIEVFTNKKDMQNRKEYVESISSQASMFAQYIYSKENVLLRLEKDLTPEQAKEYEEDFYELFK